MLTKSSEKTQRNCFKCNYEAFTEQTCCPQCRKSPLYTIKKIRLLGMGMTLAGTVSFVMMFVISYFVAGLVFAPKADSSAEFTGTNADLITVFAIFAGVLIMSFFFTTAGIWQMIFARRNKILLGLGLGLGLTMLFGGLMSLAFI